MPKWYGMDSDETDNNEEAYYLGEYDSFSHVCNVVKLLENHKIVWHIEWVFSESGLENFIKTALEALGTQVLVEVSGGVADIEAPPYIPIEFHDYDIESVDALFYTNEEEKE